VIRVDHRTARGTSINRGIPVRHNVRGGVETVRAKSVLSELVRDIADKLRQIMRQSGLAGGNDGNDPVEWVACKHAAVLFARK
jgi:hypothetical protein